MSTSEGREPSEVLIAINHDSSHAMLPLFSEYESLDAVRADCNSCKRCTLSEARHKVVFGAGNPTADIMLVGQGPSLTDDSTGLPYSGPAGELLLTALTQAEIARPDVWITNLHKCIATKVDGDRIKQRPPRVDEIEACAHWLNQEILWVKPLVIVAIGGLAAESLLERKITLSEERGQWFDGVHGLPVLATFQPTYLKRISQWDRAAAEQGWRDLIADLRLARDRSRRL